MTFSESVRGGIWSFVVADALGVPVEFSSRSARWLDPVAEMREYGTYHQPAGTWSDDSSMTLCTLEVLAEGWNPEGMMKLFSRWGDEAYMTPYDDVFDMGRATRQALTRYAQGVPAVECGGRGEQDNGNGSLMRILPVALYLYRDLGADFSRQPQAYERIHEASALTHAHPISLISCGIYCAIACHLLNGDPLRVAVERGIREAKAYYRTAPEFHDHLSAFWRVECKALLRAEEDRIRSSGFVRHSLEAALWCLLQTEDLKSCLLKAVNLGGDTDTVAAIAGGLAGLVYGYEAIPEEWIGVIPKGDLIEELCVKFCG